VRILWHWPPAWGHLITWLSPHTAASLACSSAPAPRRGAMCKIRW
jgi:hypothetical protein